MEEFMIHLIRNEGIFDLFLNDDEKKENARLKRRGSEYSDEIKIPKKRGRKPRNFIETERLKNLEIKKGQLNSNYIDLDSDILLTHKRYADINFRSNNFIFGHGHKSIFKSDFDDYYVRNKQLNIINNCDNNRKGFEDGEIYSEKDFKEVDICVEI